MSKKTFYIILIIVIGLIITGGLIWYFISKPKEVTAPASSVNFTVPGQIKNGTNLKVISEGPVLSLSKNNEVVSFYDFKGQLWQLNQDESKPVLSNQTPVENLAEIIWPKVFSPDGEKIIYQKNNGLFTSDSSGRNQRTLMSDLKLKDIILKWPTINNIALISRPSGLLAGGLWFLDTRNYSIRKVTGNFGLEILFSPDDSSFIYSYTDQNGKNPKLAIYNKRGERHDLGDISTLIDKCVWANDSISVFCAVPKDWPEGMVLPDDYYKRVNLTVDDVWKINTETEEKNLLASDLGDIRNLIIDEGESNIFFILRSDQVLYKLNLR